MLLLFAYEKCFAIIEDLSKKEIFVTKQDSTNVSKRINKKIKIKSS